MPASIHDWKFWAMILRGHWGSTDAERDQCSAFISVGTSAVGAVSKLHIIYYPDRQARASNA